MSGVFGKLGMDAKVERKHENHSHRNRTTDYIVIRTEYIKTKYSLTFTRCFINTVHYIGLDWIIGTFDKR